MFDGSPLAPCTKAFHKDQNLSDSTETKPTKCFMLIPSTTNVRVIVTGLEGLTSAHNPYTYGLPSKMALQFSLITLMAPFSQSHFDGRGFGIR